MKAPLFMGIDGGGSTLRIAIVNAKLDELGVAEGWAPSIRASSGMPRRGRGSKAASSLPWMRRTYSRSA